MLISYRHRHLRVVVPRHCVAIHVRCLHGIGRPRARLQDASPPNPAWQVPNRGKKSKASLKLDDLPQGLIPLEPLELENDTPSYPTVIQQARSNMRKFENCVLLTRVGGFYEMYFEHADEYGPLMNLKVAEKKTNAGPVSMVCLFLPSQNHH